MMGPKNETPDTNGTTFQAKEFIDEKGSICWRYDESICTVARANQLLVRIMIAKVECSSRLLGVLREIPIRADEEGWNCVGWVKEALSSIVENGKSVGTNVLDWDRVRESAMEYCRAKVDGHRFDVSGGFDMSVIPTYDLMQEKEICA